MLRRRVPNLFYESIKGMGYDVYAAPGSLVVAAYTICDFGDLDIRVFPSHAAVGPFGESEVVSVGAICSGSTRTCALALVKSWPSNYRNLHIYVDFFPAAAQECPSRRVLDSHTRG